MPPPQWRTQVKMTDAPRAGPSVIAKARQYPSRSRYEPRAQIVGGTTAVLVVLFGQAPPDTSSRELSPSASLSDVDEIVFSATSLRLSPASAFEFRTDARRQR
jgi:hypothetical protein